MSWKGLYYGRDTPLSLTLFRTDVAAFIIPPLSLTLFGTFGTNVVVGTLVWVGTALFSLPFSPLQAAREEKREMLGTPQTPAGRLRPLHPQKGSGRELGTPDFS